jgi:broad specificity phosphatase PhoE
MKRNVEDGPMLWLVRHSESTWNALALIQGQSDVAVLTRRGHRQAKKLGYLFRDVPVEALYASDLKRTQETARAIGAVLNLPVRSHEGLRERSFGSYEGRPQSSLDPAATGIRDGRVESLEARPKGGESLDELYARGRLFVEWLQDQNHRRDVVVVAHGGSIRAMRAFCAGETLVDAPWDPVANGSVCSVDLHAPICSVVQAPAQLEREGTR